MKIENLILEQTDEPYVRVSTLDPIKQNLLRFHFDEPSEPGVWNIKQQAWDRFVYMVEQFNKD